eukprot:PLAT3353.7.p1 GENE.PLAT3353.7~~PLAT3353.7.p1  ORF type:complete len:689 (-),score=282.13 PLAT3353.7:583-2649(-)
MADKGGATAAAGTAETGAGTRAKMASTPSMMAWRWRTKTAPSRRSARVAAFDLEGAPETAAGVPEELRDFSKVKPMRVRMNKRVFWNELATHLLWPLSLVIVRAQQGSHKLENGYFKDKSAAPQVHLVPLHMLSLPFLLAFLPGVERDVVGWLDIGIMLTLYALHRVIVAIKYAYMHPSEYEAQMHGVMPIQRRSEEQMVSGWLPFTRSTRLREQRRTARRLNLDLDRMYITLKLDDSLRVSASALKAMVDDAKEESAIPVGMEGYISELEESDAVLPGRMPQRLLRADELECMLNKRCGAGGSDSGEMKLEEIVEGGELTDSDAASSAGSASPPASAGGASAHSAGLAKTALEHRASGEVERKSAGKHVSLAEASCFSMRVGCFNHYLLSRLPRNKNPDVSSLPAMMIATRSAVFFALLHAAAPPVTRALMGLPVMGNNWSTIVITSSIAFEQFMWTWILMAFLATGAADYRRRYLGLHFLSLVLSRTAADKVRDDDDDDEDAAVSLGIKLRLDDVHNVRGWLVTRDLLRHIGERFFKRIQLYTSYGLMIGLGIIAGIIWILTSDYDTLLRVLPQVTSLSIDMLGIFYFVGSMISYGSKANAQADIHRGLLVKQRLEVRHRMHDASASEAARLQHVYRLLGDARDAVELEDRVQPITLLGFRASHALVKAALVALGSAAATAARVLT